ncbi:hypothetical protein [Pseudomonas monsensis]
MARYNLSAAEQLEGLRQRSLDIALVSEPPTDDDTDLPGVQVLDDPMLPALPEQPLNEASPSRAGSLLQKNTGDLH